jgi:hypothetical protein
MPKQSFTRHQNWAENACWDVSTLSRGQIGPQNSPWRAAESSPSKAVPRKRGLPEKAQVARDQISVFFDYGAKKNFILKRLKTPRVLNGATHGRAQTAHLSENRKHVVS